MDFNRYVFQLQSILHYSNTVSFDFLTSKYLPGGKIDALNIYPFTPSISITLNNDQVSIIRLVIVQFQLQTKTVISASPNLKSSSFSLNGK